MSKGTLKKLIGGEWPAFTATETGSVQSPTAGVKLADGPLGTHADIEPAFEAAATAFMRSSSSSVASRRASSETSR